ncbi:MAG: alpha/beta hydrolase-fold protein [Chitinophagaceae bacterium]
MFLKIWLVFLLCCFSGTVSGQVRVTIVVDQLPKFHNTEPVYLAGNFNSWNPADNSFKLMQQADGSWQGFVTTTPDKLLEFKFTRGSWDKVECTTDGKDVGNHTVNPRIDTTIYDTIEDWRDAHPVKPKEHTASPQVRLMDSAFYLKAIDRTRRIWIYMPKDYNAGNKRYPVLYMHDGQNLFDAFTAGFGEWGVDEILDKYFDQTGKSCIVIGIDNGPKRMMEYDPYSSEKFGKGDGELYIQSVVESLKPFVDKQYRTFKDAPHTWIAGSSMGGIISQWAVMAYPKIFGKAGVFSPAFWVAPQFKKDVFKTMKGYSGSIFFYAGEKESKTMVPDMDTVMAGVKQVAKAKLVRSVYPDGQHNEQTWNKAFPEFIRMLFEEK